MQPSMKGRLLGLLFFIAGAGLFAYNWMDLFNNNQFSVKISGLSPMMMLVSLAVIVAPSLLGVHITKDRKQTAALVTVFVIGGILGGVNFYAMDRYVNRDVAKPLDQIPAMPGQLNRPVPVNRNTSRANSKP
ncbi:MAG: hypothetical protein WBV94_19345 [Blastocatellia bacterium]